MHIKRSYLEGRLLSTAGLLWAASLIAAAPAFSHADEDHPAEDLPHHRKLLSVKDAQVRRAALYALTHYPEGLGLHVELILKNPQTSEAAQAARQLDRFAELPDFLAALTKLSDALNPRAETSTTESRYATEARLYVFRALLRHGGDKGGEKFVATLCERLVSDTRLSSLRDFWDDLQPLVTPERRATLYPLIPYLTDGILAGYDATKANSLIVAICGRDFGYRPDGTRAQRREAVERMREHYYTKIKPLIK